MEHRADWLQHPIFSAAGEAACLELARQFPAVEVPPDSILAKTGDASDTLFIILRGTVRIFHALHDGREVMVKLLRAPNTFGDIELLHQLPFLTSVSTVDAALVSRLPANEYIRWLRTYPESLMNLARHIAAAFCVAALNERRAVAPLEQWVASVLLSYSDCFGERTPDGVRINYPLSIRAVARAVGSPERAVNVVLAGWRKSGQVSKEERLFVIHQPEALERIAAPVRNSLCYHIGMPLQQLLEVPQQPDPYVELLTGSGSLRNSRHNIASELIIGTQSPSRLLVPDNTVSPQHCRVFQAKNSTKFWIEDLGSLNGTLVNGKPVRRSVLRDQDLVQLGSTKLRFHL